MAQENNRQNKVSTDPQVDAFIRGLNDQYRMLIILKSQLYGGRWEPMLEDLTNRLEGKPYIFKLANRIKDDVERIEEMQRFEVENSIDLADFVKLES